MKYKSIPYGKQFLDIKDIQNVKNALKGDLITTGKYVAELESKAQSFFNVKYALSCSSGTAALHLSFLCLEIKPGDNIIIPAINFVAAANILKMMGANIYFCDIDLENYQVTE